VTILIYQSNSVGRRSIKIQGNHQNQKFWCFLRRSLCGLLDLARFGYELAQKKRGLFE
jgi:hypothetical protein